MKPSNFRSRNISNEQVTVISSGQVNSTTMPQNRQIMPADISPSGGTARDAPRRSLAQQVWLSETLDTSRMYLRLVKRQNKLWTNIKAENIDQGITLNNQRVHN